MALDVRCYRKHDQPKSHARIDAAAAAYHGIGMFRGTLPRLYQTEKDFL